MIDPRKEPDFEPALFPFCDGAPFPALDGDENACWLIKLEFLAAYYFINRAGCRARAALASTVDRKRNQEEDARAALDWAIAQKELLDARYALQGITADPAWDGTFFHNVTFSFPRRQASRLEFKFCVPPPA